MTTLQDKLDKILELYKRQILKEENGQFVNYERLNKEEATQAILTALEAYVQTAERKARIDEIMNIFKIKTADPTESPLHWSMEMTIPSPQEIKVRLASLNSNKGESDE